MNQKLIDTITDLTSATGLPGWCERRKALHLAEIILEERPKLLVEIGVFGGRSFIPIALAAREANALSLSIGIDLWNAEAAIEGFDPSDADDAKNIKFWSEAPFTEANLRCMTTLEEQQLWPTACLMHARSEIVALSDCFAPASIDFLHLDSTHTAMVFERDVQNWLPLCRPGATIVFNDSHWPNLGYALAELEQQCDRIKIEECGTYRLCRKLA